MQKVLGLIATFAGMALGHWLYQEYKKANAPEEQTVNARDYFMAGRRQENDDED